MMVIRGFLFISLTMIFSKKNAGKWVASKNEKVVATDTKLAALITKVSSRKDKDTIGYTFVPLEQYFVGGHGVQLR